MDTPQVIEPIVLLIDDDDTVHRTVKRFLGSSSTPWIGAKTTTEARQLYDKHKATLKIILLDACVDADGKGEHKTFDTLPKYFPGYYQRRAKKGVAIRAILPDTPESRERQSRDEKELRESRLVPAKAYDFSPEINIYDDKVAIISLAEKLGIIIESKEIAEAHKKIFELAWKGAENA